LAPVPPRIDAAKETARAVSFVRKIVRGASANGVVLGLSGGIDSSVVGALCVRALSKTRVVGLVMPSDHTPAKDVKDALSMAGSWGIRTEEVPISRHVKLLTASAKIKGTRIALANVEARVRMIILYYYANTLGHLVAGTGDKSEALLGYFTKMGDGGVDFLPIAHLYKTQVRQLGTYLGIPKSVVEKPASPQLWAGHKASDEIPADYDKLDVVLYRLFERNESPHDAAMAARLPDSVAKEALEMNRKSEHKRSLPPSLA
jgi:NAD+ synthase